MKKFFFGLFIFFSFISHTITGAETSDILSRVTLADAFGALGIIFSIPMFLNKIKEVRNIPSVYLAGVTMVVCFILPLYFSLNPLQTSLESGIVFFLIVISWGICDAFKDSFFTALVPILIATVLVSTTIGFYDLFAQQYGFFKLFTPSKYPGVLLSGFKNTGQAGSYFMVFLMILVPLRFSKIYSLNLKRTKYLLDVSIVFLLIVLFLLGKYSVFAGLFVGLILFVIYSRSLKVFFLGLGMVFFFVMLTPALEVVLPKTVSRINFKYKNRIENNINKEGESSFKKDGFIVNNLTMAVRAFSDNPISGTGLGGYQGKYDTHEVHSTYFKMLGEAGVLGVGGYLFFMIALYKRMPFSWQQSKDPYKHYLQLLLSLFLGALVTWSYTYHLRKREFWILVAVILIVSELSRKTKDKIAIS